MKRKNLFIILTILSIVILGIGGTLAYYTTTATATNITQIKSGNLTMTIDGGGNSNTSFMPSKCTSSYAIKKKIVATSSNTSGGKVSFSIGMNIATLSDDLKRSTMKYALTTSSDSCVNGLIANGNFSDATVGSDIWIVKNDYENIIQINNSYTKTYYLYIWLDEAETQNLSGSISVNMKGTSSNNPSLTTEAVKSIPLYDMIKSNADTTTTIDFSIKSNSSNTNGIYMTTDTDSGEPVYYYRGNVDNRVIFANFCWRIVRTTETGGVKLIYDGVPTDGQCNNKYSNSTIGSSVFNSNADDIKYAGYMYGSSIDDTIYTNDSTIKTVVDTWYKANMTSYTTQLEDTVFCNERSYTISSPILYFGAWTRLHTNKTPTLKCQNTKDKFTVDASNGNGALTYPVGLITGDEIVYAGGIYYSGTSDENDSFYLYIGFKQEYWTMTPSSYWSVLREITLGGGVNGGGWDSSNCNVSHGVRPVLSLKPKVEFTSGLGTATDPYVVG